MPGTPVSYRISSGTGVGSTSAGFGPATRSYIESVVVRPCTSMEKSLLSFQETTRNSPDAPGMSACVIEQTIPGSVLSASAVVLTPIWRAAFHSAALVPPNSSRSRVLTIRAAWLLVDVPQRLTLDFKYIGPAPPPM